MISNKELKVPEHIGLIMDGNGRWAKEKGYHVSKGHSEGMNRIEDILQESVKLGVKHLTIYAFSTENWKREQSEIEHLLKLIKVFYKKKMKKMIEKGTKINFIGTEENVPKDILKIFRDSEEKSKNNDIITLNIAFNYGAKEEITHAVNELINSGKTSITEEDISLNLYTSGQPDIDLLIRTSGEKRLSNFMLWQVAYAEFVFSDVYWPDFKEKEFKDCVIEFTSRDRRFGGR